MRRHFVKKYLFTVLFLVAVFTFSVVNAYYVMPEIVSYIKEEKWANISELVAGMENIINEKVYQKYAFVELNAFSTKVQGSNIENGFDFVKAKNGDLQYSNLVDSFQDSTYIKNSILRVKDMAIKAGVEPLLLLAPQKYIEGESEFEKGIPYSDKTPILDDLVSFAKENDIRYTDTREYIDEIKKYTGKDIYYKTDHHWRVETGFYMYGVLLDKLQENWSQDLNAEFYKDLENYNIYEYKNSFLGSMGRETGVLYSGLDDFTLMYPKFETNFKRNSRFTVDGEWVNKEGTTYESLLSIYNLKYDDSVYTSDKYGTYLDGINVEDHITNTLNPNGPRILVVCDSFMAVPATFLANNCSQLDMVWSIMYDGDFMSLLEQGNYDYVIIQLSGVNLENENIMNFIW